MLGVSPVPWSDSPSMSLYHAKYIGLYMYSLRQYHLKPLYASVESSPIIGQQWYRGGVTPLSFLMETNQNLPIISCLHFDVIRTKDILWMYLTVISVVERKIKFHNSQSKVILL